MQNTHCIDKVQMKKSFNNAALTYDQAARLQQQVAQNLLHHELTRPYQHQQIVDLGAGTGYLSRLFDSHHINNNIIAIDIAEKMLNHATNQTLTHNELYPVCADVEFLPIASNQVDLIISNLTLQWCSNIDAILQECARLLKPGGQLIFSSLGPDTLWELRQSWNAVDDYPHVNQFLDTKQLRQKIVASPLQLCHIKSELLQLYYPTVQQLMKQIKAIGAHNVTIGRAKGLTGKHKYFEVRNNYEAFRTYNQQLPVTYEVIYVNTIKSF